jgi:HSP20 family molecular chaperone IbpA
MNTTIDILIVLSINSIFLSPKRVAAIDKCFLLHNNPIIISEYVPKNRIAMAASTYHQNKKKVTNARLLANGVAFLALASVPELASAHRRYGYGSCSRSYDQGYPRRYDCHRGNYCGTRSCRPRRHRYGFNAAIDIFDDLVHASMNSLTRQQQQRRNVDVADAERKQQPRYFIEDYGRNGLELTVQVPGLKAREIDLEIIQNDGINTIAISGSGAGIRRRGSVVSPRFSQSFVINDNTINVDGITANVSSGVLTIYLPRKVREGRKRWSIPSVFKEGSFDDNSKSGDEILVFDSKRGITHRTNERSARQSVIVEETLGKTSDESNSIKSDEQPHNDDDLYISEEEDIW